MTNLSRTVKEKEQQPTISLLEFEKTKILPCWRADRSGPELRHP